MSGEGDQHRYGVRVTQYGEDPPPPIRLTRNQSGIIQQINASSTVTPQLTETAWNEFVQRVNARPSLERLYNWFGDEHASPRYVRIDQPDTEEVSFVNIQERLAEYKQFRQQHEITDVESLESVLRDQYQLDLTEPSAAASGREHLTSFIIPNTLYDNIRRLRRSNRSSLDRNIRYGNGFLYAIASSQIGYPYTYNWTRWLQPEDINLRKTIVSAETKPELNPARIERFLGAEIDEYNYMQAALDTEQLRREMEVEGWGGAEYFIDGVYNWTTTRNGRTYAIVLVDSVAARREAIFKSARAFARHCQPDEEPDEPEQTTANMPRETGLSYRSIERLLTTELRRANARTINLRDSIASAESSIERVLSDLRAHRDRIAEYESELSRLATVDIDIDDAYVAIEQRYQLSDALLNNRAIQSIEWEGEHVLRFTTHSFGMRSDQLDRPVLILPLTFRIDTDVQRFGNAIRLRNGRHPHANGEGGTCCWGEAAPPLSDAWSRQDWHSVVLLILSWCGQYNRASPYITIQRMQRSNGYADRYGWGATLASTAVEEEVPF